MIDTAMFYYPEVNAKYAISNTTLILVCLVSGNVTLTKYVTCPKQISQSAQSVCTGEIFNSNKTLNCT